MTYVVLVADDIHERGLSFLKEAHDFEVAYAIGDPKRLSELLGTAHALLVRSSTQVTDMLLEQAPCLRVIGRAGIGVDNIDVEAATRRGVAVLNAPGANTVSAAEHMFALLLALVRRVPWAAASMQHGEWNRKQFGGTELRGKTLGLVGVGRIGGHVATIANAFGMELLAYDPFVTEVRASTLHVTIASLERVLSIADVVSLHAPLTDETRHMINANRLALMKPSAVLVNTARGGLVDEAALLGAVESGRIAGAAMDVFETEPLPADSPLRRADRVIVTPHLAATTQEAQERVSVEICRSVERALRSGDVGGAVNIPGVTSEVLARLDFVLRLAKRIGHLAGDLARGRVASIEVHYGGGDDGAPKPVMLAAAEGVLQSMGVGPVSLINAAFLAEERRIGLCRRVGKAEAGFDTTIGVTVQTPERATTVVGGIVGEQPGRLIRIDEFAVDIPATGDLLILRNRDVPGVIGRVGTILGEAQVNIGSYHQARWRDQALAAIAVDQLPRSTVLERLEQVPDVLEVRLARLDGTT
jgi:D-3-phosphoglycerate dehydrogenase